MNKKISALLICLFTCLLTVAQSVGVVDKKTKEFFIASNLKTSYQIFGFQFPNKTTQHMICFSSNPNDVRDNEGKCPLGAYFNTSVMKEGGKILYLGAVGEFAKMQYQFSGGKKTLFYLPKTSFIMAK